MQYLTEFLLVMAGSICGILIASALYTAFERLKRKRLRKKSLNH